MKYIGCIVRACMLFILLTQQTHAQTAGRTQLTTGTAGMDRAAVKAVRDFWNRYGETKNEQWYQLDHGLLAEYTREGIKNKTVYDSRGNWLYTILEYSEQELPTETRALVKSTYYDYAIGWIKEVRQGEEQVYVIRIEDRYRWKNLVIQNGEMRVIADYKK